MHFLNSSNWRKFQESVGRKTFDIGEGFLVKLDMPLGKNYLYSNYPGAVGHLQDIKSIGLNEGSMLFKWEPMMEGDMEIGGAGFKKAAKELQPQKTIILDIQKEDKELLAGMHSKTRYNVRLAKKRGLTVKRSENKESEVEAFWGLLKETAQRDNFHTHTRDYYRKLVQLDMADLYFARKGDEVHAAALVVSHEGRATYLHGASSYEHRRDMAPHLLHWEIIKDAKTEGMEEYDLWGIDESKWPGMTRFKRGLGGHEVEYIGSWDLPLNMFWYRTYAFKNKLS